MKIIFQTLPGWFEWLSLIIIPFLCAIITSVLNIYFVNKNTNKQIQNQNKETYRPRLKLHLIEEESDDDEYRYYACGKKYDEKENELIYINIQLENIGNGLAEDIKFYNLCDGNICIRSQAINFSKNQDNMSTEEIAKGCIEKFHFKFNLNANEDKNKSDEGDFILLICEYKDLNNNSYEFLVGFLYKGHQLEKMKDFVPQKYLFDSYYYQSNTKEYKGMIKKYEKNYKNIKNCIGDDKGSDK